MPTRLFPCGQDYYLKYLVRSLLPRTKQKDMMSSGAPTRETLLTMHKSITVWVFSGRWKPSVLKTSLSVNPKPQNDRVLT